MWCPLWSNDNPRTTPSFPRICRTTFPFFHSPQFFSSATINTNSPISGTSAALISSVHNAPLRFFLICFFATCYLWILWPRQWFSVQSSTVCLPTTDPTCQACVLQRSLRPLSVAFLPRLPPLNALVLVVLAILLRAVTTRVQWTNHLSPSFS